MIKKFDLFLVIILFRFIFDGYLFHLLTTNLSEDTTFLFI